MKKKKIIVETTYFGNIRRCIHLNRENNYTYINSELVAKDRMLLKTTTGSYITGSDYISKNNNLLGTQPTREGELYVDETSLVLASEKEKINEKSLHL